MSMGVCKWNVGVIVVEVVLIVLFGLFVEYDPEVKGEERHHDISGPYSMFQDVHVMVFIGFGFLMTFMKRYSYSSVGFNFFFAALLLQWATLCIGFFKMNDHGKIEVSIHSLIAADIGVASFLISFGVLLGKCTLEQYLIAGLIEIALFAVNEHIVYHIFEVADVGGSMVVHVFGSYFGMGCSFFLYRKGLENEKVGPNHTSDMTSMLGSLFLWLFWPSFNSIFASGAAMHRAIVNTYYSLAACTITTFATCSLLDRHKKIEMEFIQNATLAGGVAAGAVANMLLQPFGAMITGGLAGIITCAGFHYVSPWLYKHCRIHDTCGVHNLHGMPGILSGLLSALVASLVDPDDYGSGLSSVFPAMGEDGHHGHAVDHHVTVGHGGREASRQALYQLAALGCTIAIALIGGLLTSLLLTVPGIQNKTPTDMLYEDNVYWEMPEEEESKENHEAEQNDTKF